MHTLIFNEMSRLQYNVSISCSTIWRKYGKLQMFISITMEMEKLYSQWDSEVGNKYFQGDHIFKKN